jgi:hypothetical protein
MALPVSAQIKGIRVTRRTRAIYSVTSATVREHRIENSTQSVGTDDVGLIAFGLLFLFILWVTKRLGAQSIREVEGCPQHQAARALFVGTLCGYSPVNPLLRR